MGLYNDKVMDHFMNPHNVGEIENADGTGTYGSPVCGDMMIGKTIDEALAITNKQIIDELGGLPAVKVHCSVLADHAIKSAIYDYAQKNGKTYAGLEGFDPDADDDDEHGCTEEE